MGNFLLGFIGFWVVAVAMVGVIAGMVFINHRFGLQPSLAGAFCGGVSLFTVAAIVIAYLELKK
jgi:hypothetical protein